MQFEWDEQKNLSNQEKHKGIDFLTAIAVFDDPNRLEVDSTREHGENRIKTIGIISDMLVIVVISTNRAFI